MKVSEEHSPNRYTFKIPSKTGKTIYEKNFFSKEKYTPKNQ